MLLLGACGASDPVVVTFDPAAPCPAEGQQPGAYPELEAMLDTGYEGRAPDSVDSGRVCSPEALGSLADAGIPGLRFAGATWQTGGTSGLTLAVFKADGLDATKMLEFMPVGRERAPDGEAPALRHDRGRDSREAAYVLGSDGTGQTVVAWQVAGEDVVRVLLAADLGDAKVAALLETLGTP